MLIMFLVCFRSRSSYILFDFKDIRTAAIYSAKTILPHKLAPVTYLSVPFHSNSYIHDIFLRGHYVTPMQSSAQKLSAVLSRRYLHTPRVPASGAYFGCVCRELLAVCKHCLCEVVLFCFQFKANSTP